jgi:hypothetical protein
MFKAEINGLADAKARLRGRPVGTTKKNLANRKIKEEALLALLRKLKPHLTDAVKAATDIMNDATAKDVDRLRASATIITTYKQLIEDVYKDEDGAESAPEIQPKGAKVSFLFKPEVKEQ